MHEDEQEARRILAWTERLYVLEDPSRLAEHALLVLLDATGGTRGYTLFAPRGGHPSMPHGGARLVDAAAIQRAEVLAAGRERLAQPAVLMRHSGPLARALDASMVTSLRVDHRNQGASLWLLELPKPTQPRLHSRLETLGRTIGYAGELMLAQDRSWLADAEGARRARLDTLFPQPGSTPPQPVDEDPLDGLDPLAADCARLAARGYTNREISRYLSLAASAVGRHLSSTYRHLQIDGRHQLDVSRLLAQPKPPPRNARAPDARVEGRRPRRATQPDSSVE